ncbi:hypothetical protein DFAR_3320011 [Desulfarculales bacterium]
MALANAFDAIRSLRPYRESLPAEQAWEQLRRMAGSHFALQAMAWLKRVAQSRADDQEWLESLGII